jgi:hypothetical protein
VEFDGFRRPLTSAETSTLAIGSSPATRTTGTWEGLHVIQITMNTPSASVVITSPSLELAEQLAATLHLVDVDPTGCPERSQRPAPGEESAPTQSGATDALIPGEPDQIAVCRYVSTYLEQGRAIERSDAAAFIATLNGLPAGLSETRQDAYPTICNPPSPSDPHADVGRSFDDTAYTIRVSYPDTSTLIIDVRLGYCGKLGASNGARTGQRTNALIELVMASAGGSSVPEYVHPAP